jgi:acyl-CoA dehydrogenase
VPVIQIPQEFLDLRDSLRQFIDREIRPIEESHRQDINEGRFEVLGDERRKIRKRSAELGFWSLHMPEEVGGMGLSYLGQVVLFEEATGQGLLLTIGESLLPMVTGPTPVYLDCTEPQREKYLQPLMAADKSTCFALTEPEAGSDATRIKTRAVKDGDQWVLNGRKHFITGGQEADFALVFAVTDPTSGRREGSRLSWWTRTPPGTRCHASRPRCRRSSIPLSSRSRTSEFPRVTFWGSSGSGSTRPSRGSTVPGSRSRPPPSA